MRRLGLVCAVLAAAACGKSENNTENSGTNTNNMQMTPLTEEDHACMHMESGPESAVTAAGMGETPPELSAPYTRFDITLPAETATLAFEIDEATLAHFYFDVPVNLLVQDGRSGDEIMPTAEFATVATCEQVDSGVAYDLAAGPYLFTISDSPSELSMVFVPEQEDAQDE